MKLFKLLALSLTVAALSSPAHAISASYRHQLEKSGCTQVTDSDGTCDIHKTKKQNQKKLEVVSYGNNLVGQSISDAADAMITDGWKANNGVWKRRGYTLKLTVDGSGTIQGYTIL